MVPHPATYDQSSMDIFLGPEQGYVLGEESDPTKLGGWGKVTPLVIIYTPVFFICYFCQDIIEQLIENSETFGKKTEFSQEKYVNKKRKR